ncbi:MAG: hypothetical protein JXM70_29890 [Pirellulales bacterium]|nr:hypothetical protein [Pirellulales bacterium]
MKHWQTVMGLFVAFFTITAPVVMAASPTTVPRSDGCVFNIDFDGFWDGGAGFLNAGVRKLGDGAPDVRQTEAFIINSSEQAFNGNKCAHIVTKKPGPGAQIDLQRRFDVPDVADEVIELVYRPTADKPVDLNDFVLWRAVGYRGGMAGIALIANGTASDGTYNLSVQTASKTASRIKDVVAGLKQTEWIRVIMARSRADKNVSLWVGPPNKERFVGEYTDADPNSRVGRASFGNVTAGAARGAGFWDDIRVGKALGPNDKVAPGEVLRHVGRELPVIDYPIAVDRQKQLFVDDAIIESTTGLKRTLHSLEKHSHNPVLEPTTPWEMPCRVFLPYEVIRETPGAKFRVWYGCYIREKEGQPKRKLTYVCLAESADGLQWTRPDVNRYTVNGVKQNSAVWEGRAFKTIFDPRDPDPKRRYKGMTRVNGFTPVFSPDGIRWTMFSDSATNQAYDATSFHWDPIDEKWIASVKIFHNTKRIRGYAESSDFVHWSDTYPMLEADNKDGPRDQTYSMRIFRYETVFVGLLKIYHLDTDRCDVQLAFSRNAKHWERPDRSIFLANAKQPGGYDYGNIDEAGAPIRMNDQLWFYYSGRSTLHNEKSDKPDGSLCLGTLRLDGFMSMDAGNEEGTLLTKPVKLSGSSLLMNADAGGGEIRVEIVKADSKEPIVSFSKENCVPLTEDNVRQKVTWRGNSSSDLPKDKTVRLKFHLRNAKLYSFWTEGS